MNHVPQVRKPQEINCIIHWNTNGIYWKNEMNRTSSQKKLMKNEIELIGRGQN